MEYLKWNAIISTYYFNATKAGKEVLLYITKNEICRLGISNFGFASEEESWEDYCATCRKGLKFTGKKPFSENVKIAIDEWLKYSRFIFDQKNTFPFQFEGVPVTNPDNGITYPFFIAFIPLLIIPFTQNNNGVRSNSYYVPLSEFLTINHISSQKEGSSSFEHIDPMWPLLEKWTKVYCKTDLGIFTERHFGNPNWRHVGKPLSQCILTPKNIRDIPKMFWAANIAPFSFVSNQQLERIIIRYGHKSAGFSQRVIDIFNDPENPLKKIITDIVKAEFDSWQGDVIEYGEEDNYEKPKSGLSYGALLSAFTLTNKNETFNHFYHLFSKNDFPDDLILGGKPVIHLANGFSEKIIEPFNQNIEWADPGNKWRATPSKSELVLYISGSYFGLPSDTYIETDKISLVSRMYLLCPAIKKESIEVWGKTFAPGNFKRIDYDHIPPGYTLYRFQNPIAEHPSEQLLEFKNERKIEIKGGIKVSNREYLPEMLPTVWLPGTTGHEKLYLEYVEDRQHISLQRNSAIPEEFFLPETIKQGRYFTIKMDEGSLVGDDIPYNIIDSSFSPLDIVEDNLGKRNCRGELSRPDDAEYVRGSNTVYSHWSRQQAYSTAFIPLNYDPIEYQTFQDTYLPVNGNLVLEYLTLKRNANLEGLSSVMESLAAKSPVWDNKSYKINPKYIKRQAIHYYDFAGYLDYDDSLDKITVNRPQILIIPSNRSVEAILIGGRTKRFVDRVISTCAERRIIITIVPQQKQLDQYLLPDTIKLIPAGCQNSMQAWSALRDMAAQLDIGFYVVAKPYAMPQIVQFGLQDFSATLKEYKEYVLANKAINIKDFAWARKTFNPDTLAFEKDDLNPVDKNLSLQEYYLQYKYKYILWFNGTSYEVDGNWGRFLVLGEQKKHVIFYSNTKQVLAIPKMIELPRLIAESITLLSGSTPYFRKLEIGGKTQIFQLYANVPKLFAENLFRKFNQDIQPNLQL